MIATESIHRAGPIPTPVRSMSRSGSVHMATNSRHSYQGQTHSGLPDSDSRPSFSINSASNRVESPPRNSEPNLRDMGNYKAGLTLHDFNSRHSDSPTFR